MLHLNLVNFLTFFLVLILEIHAIGDVSTDYTWGMKSDFQSNIDRWRQSYRTQEILFDEMSFYTFAVGNARTLVSPCFFNTVDNIVTFLWFLKKFYGFPTSDEICSQETNGKGWDVVTILAYNIQSPDYNGVTRVKYCAGFAVTGDGGATPRGSLPDYLVFWELYFKSDRLIFCTLRC